MHPVSPSGGGIKGGGQDMYRPKKSYRFRINPAIGLQVRVMHPVSASGGGIKGGG
ncbi:MAG: hypothetical protein H7069_12520 [Phormidesmis sp. FL-bin-119]|nr:hypothetical protein [Pedobacter sp.]